MTPDEILGLAREWLESSDGKDPMDEICKDYIRLRAATEEVRRETIEECAKVAERDAWDLAWNGHIRSGMQHAAFAIRSLLQQPKAACRER